MKINFYLLAVLVSVCSIHAADDSLSQSLQKGLFEEEANHDLKAAIEIYKDVASRFDEQRKVAATALFRLAECHRKLGKTTEAQQYYRRIVSEFPDQENLVAQASAFLPNKGAPAQNASSLTMYQLDKLADNYARAISAAIQVESLQKVLKSADTNNFWWGLTTVQPDAALESSLTNLGRVEDELAQLRSDYSSEHPAVMEKEAVRKTLLTEINDRVPGIMLGLEALRQSRQARSKQEKEHLEGILSHATPDNRALILDLLIWKMESAYDEIGATSEQALYSTLSNLSKEDLRKALPTARPDPTLDKLLNQLSEAELRYTSAKVNYSDEHPDVARVKLLLKRLNQQIDAKLGGTMKGLKLLSEAGESAKAAFVKELDALREEASRVKVTDKQIASKTSDDVETVASQAQGIFQRRLAEIVNRRDASELEGLEALFRNSPDLLNARGATNGMTFLQNAATKGNLEMVKFLIQKKADLEIPLGSQQAGIPSRNALHMAVENGHKAIVDALLDSGAKVNARTSLGKTALHLAANSGFREIALVLLAKGADVNARDNQGNTPLHDAMGNASHIALELLDKGADVNARNSSNTTPLYYAVEGGSVDLIDLLLKRGADPNVVTSTQNSILFSAVMRSSNPEVLQLLIKSGADLKFQDREGMTALHWAANGRKLDFVKLLVEGGADVNAKNFAGVTALHIAVTGDAYDIAEYLLNHGADPSATTANNVTPLHEAVKDWRLVQLLIAKGAKVNAVTHDGYTPLDATRSNGKITVGLRVVELLKAKGATNCIYQHVAPIDSLIGAPSSTTSQKPASNIDPVTGVPAPLNRQIPSPRIRENKP
jgi:ankyrin repeat protein